MRGMKQGVGKRESKLFIWVINYLNTSNFSIWTNSKEAIIWQVLPAVSTWVINLKPWEWISTLKHWCWGSWRIFASWFGHSGLVESCRLNITTNVTQSFLKGKIYCRGIMRTHPMGDLRSPVGTDIWGVCVPCFLPNKSSLDTAKLLWEPNWHGQKLTVCVWRVCSVEPAKNIVITVHPYCSNWRNSEDNMAIHIYTTIMFPWKVHHIWMIKTTPPSGLITEDLLQQIRRTE